MRILCVGVSHKTADVALREKLAMDDARTRAALAELSGRFGGAEFAILSTCNRTEIYAARPIHGHPRTEELRALLVKLGGLTQTQCDDAFYDLADAAAVRHLLAVAAGLDSMILGEPQIASQVKKALTLAGEAGAAGGVLTGLFQTALHVSKHIRTETPVGLGRSSVAAAAVDLVRQTFVDLNAKCVLNVGAGKMSDLMLRSLCKLKPRQVLLANRTASRARELAGQFGGKAVAWSRLGEHLAAADVVLASTGSRQPIITRSMLAAAQRKRRWRPMLIMDIAVPRDVEAAGGGVRGVRLLNIDDLQRLGCHGKGNHANLVRAESIIARHVAQVVNKLNVRGVAPTIEALYERLRQIADEELAQAVRKLSAHHDAAEDQKVLALAIHRTIRRILHTPARNLRREAGSDAARAHVAAIRKLFELDAQE